MEDVKPSVPVFVIFISVNHRHSQNEQQASWTLHNKHLMHYSLLPNVTTANLMFVSDQKKINSGIIIIL